MLAVTRHPVMWGLGLWSLSHLAVVADAAEALRFLCFAILAARLPADRIEISSSGRQWGAAAWRDFTRAIVKRAVPGAAAGPRAARLARDRLGADRCRGGAISRMLILGCACID